MKTSRKILWAAIIVFIGIQFWRPIRNTQGQPLATDLSVVVNVPLKVQKLLQQSCYDCHSNNTAYPWYASTQPVAWFMSNHIRKGKSELNFSEFGSYSPRKQSNKLKSVANVVRKEEMPLSSYLWLHRAARLSDIEKLTIIHWADSTALILDN